MTDDSLLKSVRRHLSDRFRSPLFLNFVVSWCAWNYRAVIVVFSGMTVQEKFTFLDQQLYPPESEPLRHLLWGPVITTVAYVVLFPWPSLLAVGYSLLMLRVDRWVKQLVDGTTSLTKQESEALNREADERVRKSEAETARYKAQARELSAELDSVRSVNNALKAETAKLASELRAAQAGLASAQPNGVSRVQGLILQAVQELSPRVISRDDLIDLIRSGGVSSVDVGLALAELLEQGLLRNVPSDLGLPGLAVTSAGLKALSTWLRPSKSNTAKRRGEARGD